MGFGEVAELLGLEECHRKADDRIVEPVRAIEQRDVLRLKERIAVR